MLPSVLLWFVAVSMWFKETFVFTTQFTKLENIITTPKERNNQNNGLDLEIRFQEGPSNNRTSDGHQTFIEFLENLTGKYAIWFKITM